MLDYLSTVGQIPVPGSLSVIQNYTVGRQKWQHRPISAVFTGNSLQLEYLKDSKKATVLVEIPCPHNT